MEWVLAILAVLAVMFCVGVGLTVLVVRAIRRLIAPVVQRAGLAVSARAPGDGGAVARLRRDLDEAVRRGRRALAVAETLGSPVGDAPGLIGRIETAAADTSAELQAISAVADPARRAGLLGAAKLRVAELVDAADDLAEAVAHAAAVARSDFGELRSACLAEAEALREGARVGESWGRLT
jgi:sugar phosphate isomerase/epimerase